MPTRRLVAIILAASFGKDYLVTRLSIIGTGKMGQAIAGIATKGGHTVELLGKDDPATGELVVLAVPHSAMHDLVQQRLDSLRGKVVVDISNPVNFETLDSLTVASDTTTYGLKVHSYRVQLSVV